jgi:hypothetical protein
MKTIFVLLLALTCSAAAFSQPGVPQDVEFALGRIENAFRMANPGSIEDMLSWNLTIRLADSLYQGVSRIQSLDLLKKFFADKDSIDFRFSLPGSGTMVYSSAGKRDTTQVDVWLRGTRDDIGLYAINISNYPLATVFFDIHGHKFKTKK